MTQNVLSHDGWVLRPQPRHEPTMRIFCLPHAGGNASAFAGWPAHLPDSVEVCAIQLPGRQQRIAEAPYRQFEPLLAGLMSGMEPLLDLPFVLFGNCTGSLVAFEAARRLRRAGREPDALVVSCSRAPQVPDKDQPVHGCTDDELIAELRRLGGTPSEVLAHRGLLEVMLPAIRADFELAETYEYVHAEPLTCPVYAFGGRRDEVVAPAEIEAWRLQTTGAFSLTLLDGGHYLLESHPAELANAAPGVAAARLGAAG